MTMRREFLAHAGLAGVCFVGPHRAHAQPRRTVKVGGKRADKLAILGGTAAKLLHISTQA